MVAIVAPVPGDDAFESSKLAACVLTAEFVPLVSFQAIGPATLGKADRAAAAPVAEAAAERTGTFQPNGGSIGHPVICSRPCMYFSLGQCASGDSCCFCHMSHPKRAPHLDKQHRAKLQKLAPETQRALLISIIKAKLVAVDDSEVTHSVIEDLVATCGVADPNFPDPACMPHADQKLCAALSSLPLRALLTNLKKTFSEHKTRIEIDVIARHCQTLALFATS